MGLVRRRISCCGTPSPRHLLRKVQISFGLGLDLGLDLGSGVICKVLILLGFRLDGLAKS